MPMSVQRWVYGSWDRRRHKEPRDRYLRQIDTALEGFAGKRVLEIGSGTQTDVLRRLQDDFDVAEAIGIDPASEPRDVGDRGRVLRQDARTIPFSDGYFDLALSMSAFEHIRGLDEVLAAAYRVLKPGGLLYAHFGPIWSTSYGHHLWFDDHGQPVTYHRFVLPAWCHLVDSHEDVRRACISLGMTEDLAARTVGFVFESPEQNQLLFSDYADLVAASDFEVVFFKGYDAPDLALRYQDAQDPARLAKVAATFPSANVSEFLYDGIVMLLRRPSTAG
jgi:ubiquinone/menaquinone biosynthesis C-methylase UbiE